MPLLALSARLVAYFCCIGLALRYGHKLFHNAADGILKTGLSKPAKSALASAAALVPFSIVLAISVGFAAIDDRQPLSFLGLSWDAGSLDLAGFGIAIGFCCVMLMFAAGVMMKFIRIVPQEPVGERGDHLARFCAGTTDYFAGAVLEEIVTRGYIYYTLNAAFGWVTAVVGSAVIFSLVHLIRPNRLPFMFTVNAFLFGLLTGVCRYYTGSLWLPIGLHLAWNVTAGPILGLPYSGAVYDRGMVRSEVSGPEWLMGGLYSPDAGMVGTCALVLAAIGLRLLTPLL